MATVRLKGLNKATKKLADGRVVTHWYAWRGGPKLPGEYGSDEFVAAYLAAKKTFSATAGDALKDLIERYERAPEFAKLATSTKAERLRWHRRLLAHRIASLPRAALNDPKAKEALMAWRDEYAAKSPRNADYAVQTLSAVLAWGHQRGLLSVNLMAGVGQLYRSDRSDQIWEPAEIERFAEHASPQVAHALRLACLTGLRRSDLIALTWGEVGDTYIVKRTRKTGATVTVPIVPELTELLAKIGRLGPSVTVLLNTRGKPWSADGLENRIIKAKTAAGIDKHLHDARGTFATRLRHAGLTASEISDVMGWESKRVERILARYVDREAIVRRLADRLGGNKAPTDLQTRPQTDDPE
jgi:integrase